MAEDKEEKQSNAKVIKAYFGAKEGQGLQEFLQEYKALTEEDKDQLGEGIRNGTLTY